MHVGQVKSQFKQSLKSKLVLAMKRSNHDKTPEIKNAKENFLAQKSINKLF